METYNIYKIKHDLDFRIGESRRLLEKYPSRKPIIIQTKISAIENLCSRVLPTYIFAVSHKNYYNFLIPDVFTVRQLKAMMEQTKILLNKSDATLHCNNKALIDHDKIDQVYEKHKDNDGFLYVFY